MRKLFNFIAVIAHNTEAMTFVINVQYSTIAFEKQIFSIPQLDES